MTYIFSAYFDHNIQKQPKTMENLILYIMCNMDTYI